MKKFMVAAVAASVLLCALAQAPVHAEERLVQVSIITPIQLFPEEDSISGLRLNLLYGRNVSVTGLDLGLVNHTSTGMMTGLQYGLVGIADNDFTGWQDNSINIVRNDFKGMQWGLVNYARNAKGFQLGFVNYTWTMEGLQIGLLNIIREGAMVPVLPLVNWCF